MVKLKGGGWLFFWRTIGGKEGCMVRPQEQLVLIKDQKNRNKSTLPLLFIRPHYKLLNQGKTFYDKILWIDSRMSQKSHCGEGLIITYSFQEKSVGKYDAVMFTYLKVLFIVCFHNFFKIIFHKQKLTWRLSLKFS